MRHRKPPYTCKRLQGRVHRLTAYRGESSRWQVWPWCGIRSTPPGAKTRQLLEVQYQTPEPPPPDLMDFYPYIEEGAPAVAVAAAMPVRTSSPGKRQRREPYCLACGKPLEGRRDKKYCDDACRQAGNRINVTTHVHRLAKNGKQRHGLRSKTVKPHSAAMSRLTRGSGSHRAKSYVEKALMED